MSHHRGARPHQPGQARGWRKLGWPVKAPLFAAALVVGLMEHSLRWSGAALAAGVALIIPIVGFRDFWGMARFWATVCLLTLVQVSLVIGMRPVSHRLGLPFMLGFGILDCALVIAAISWVCSED
jgi:hypothetical protein